MKMQMMTILTTTCANTYPGAFNKFHASKSWFYQFLKRHNLSFQRHTKIGQKLPDDLNKKITDFQTFIIHS